MKHFLIASGIVACLFLSSGQGFAQIDNLTNMSAEWVRMSNRNAATDAADIMVYNPAGLISLPDGFHLNVSNQMMFRKPSHSFNDPLDPLSGRLSYEQDSPDLFVPNLYASYKKGLWSIFGGVYMPGSAGAIDYPDGSITTHKLGALLLQGQTTTDYQGITNEHLEGSSSYLTTSIGGAYKISDKISVAAGIRNISASNAIKGGLTLTGGTIPDSTFMVNVEQKDNGWGGILGVQVRLDDKLNLALHYESPVKLDLKTDIKSGDNISETAELYADGERNRRDFPGMIGMGASYQFTPKFRGELDANYWFQNAANWGKASDGKDISSLAGDCWSIGVAWVYQISPELGVSAGTLYTLFRWNDMDAYYNANPGSVEVQYSDDVNFAAGFGYKVLPGLKLNCGLNYTWWKDESIFDSNILKAVDMENSTFIFAVGFDYSI